MSDIYWKSQDFTNVFERVIVTRKRKKLKEPAVMKDVVQCRLYIFLKL